MEMLNNYWNSYEFMTWEYSNEEEQHEHHESLKGADWKLFGKPFICVSVYKRPFIKVDLMHCRTGDMTFNLRREIVDNFSYVYETITWKYNNEQEQEAHCKSSKGDSWQLLSKPSELTSIYERPLREIMHYKRQNRKFKKDGVSLW